MVDKFESKYSVSICSLEHIDTEYFASETTHASILSYRNNKISQPYVLQLKMSQISRFRAVYRNRESRKRGKFCGKILTYTVLRSKLIQELKPLDHLNKIKNFSEKSSSAMKWSSFLAYTSLISKICIIGLQQTHMCLKIIDYIHKKWCDWAIFYREWRCSPSYGQWSLLSCNVGGIFLVRIGWTWHQW